MIEQKLDIFIPISHQPRDVVSDIIADASIKFPEFASCVRKRIRTFLKSYRRSKKLKEGSSGSPQSHTNGVSKVHVVCVCVVGGYTVQYPPGDVLPKISGQILITHCGLILST